VRELCDRVVVMKAGKIVEEGETSTVLSNPEHRYTRQLLEAMPTLQF
jgi:ABC-type dipeptide/oligopeptide/nickel transport system ATPase component